MAASDLRLRIYAELKASLGERTAAQIAESIGRSAGQVYRELTDMGSAQIVDGRRVSYWTPMRWRLLR